MFQPVSVKKSSPPRSARPELDRLEVGPVDDSLEKEASRTAERVLNGPQPKIHHSAAQQAGSSGAHAAPLTSGGRALDAGTREYFEPRFGYDFSRVRIHSNDEAAAQASSLGANAYTAGAQIAFTEGRYTPGSREGRRLLAHELTHVIQQGEAPALSGIGASRAAVGRVGTRIQRDTPQGQQQPNPPEIGPLSITKSAGMISRQEVTEALTKFLYKAQGLQGGQALRVDETVRTAVLRLFKEDPVGSASVQSLLDGAAPGSPPDFAAAVTRFLPEMVWPERVKFLGVMPSAAPTDKNVLRREAKDLLKKATDVEGNRQQKEAGSPLAPWKPPSNFPGFPTLPGEHSMKTPQIPWDIPTKPIPKPNLPQDPLASEDKGVDAIIKGLDDNLFIPDSAKGNKEKSEEFANAKEVARTLANMLQEANAKKRYTVELNLPMGYRGQPDLADIFDKIEGVVKRIVEAIPGGVPNVGEVVIQPAKMPGDKTFPPRRIVKVQ